ncbi:MAG TPA: prepilin-type N-terminal cleavage/methylation domain-containing protein [Candidatus Omnitrophota bacterium]|nr:prepilin-type N-terminal cleavage/methylation domain-containing protein [Candidatus Omnitrophota bacterium]HPS37142.1 prepilin-type N-terminal cleavage/methylation domain-containing protein [Candidatus Omnitrophota bacterium]
MWRIKGFTLIEVLIVVVIIAVLAALILPRMTASGKRADAAEAMQMMGLLKRSVIRYVDLGGTTLNLQVGCPPDWGNDLGNSSDWARLGVKIPVSSKWGYNIAIQDFMGTGQLFVNISAVSKSPTSTGFFPNARMSFGLLNGNQDVGWTCSGMNYLYDSNDNTKKIGCTF